METAGKNRALQEKETEVGWAGCSGTERWVKGSEGTSGSHITAAD